MQAPVGPNLAQFVRDFNWDARTRRWGRRTRVWRGGTRGRRRPRVPAASDRVVPRGKARIGPTRPKSGRLGPYRPYRPVSAETAESGRKKKKRCKRTVLLT